MPMYPRYFVTDNFFDDLDSMVQTIDNKYDGKQKRLTDNVQIVGPVTYLLCQ